MNFITSYSNLCVILFTTLATVKSAVVDLTSDNLQVTLSSNELVFVNFYADWCRFSQMLTPIFNEASDKVQSMYTQPGKVILAKVDCDKQPDIARQFSVSKYPTLKLFRNGQMVKREYRGTRSVDALSNFVREQMKDPVEEFTSIAQMEDLNRDKRTIVGYFERKDSEEYKTFESVGKLLQEDCRFYAGFGEISKRERTTGDNVIYRPAGNDPEMVYMGSLLNMNLLRDWATDKCVPLVREITFANGEELTEEGLPFLILFHKAEDTLALEKYKKEISRSLITEKGKITFLHADCDKFSHPLHHLGKSPRDCPLIAIDSFKHMYLFDNFEDMDKPGKLKSFVNDLHSGKLHREFHHGPDPTTADPNKIEIPDDKLLEFIQTDDFNKLPEDIKGQLLSQANEVIGRRSAEGGKVEGVSSDSEGAEEVTTIESVFKNLKPSDMRYTILKGRDEL